MNTRTGGDMPVPGRYTDAPLPPYRYIPGRTAHPHRDPSGHSHGRHDPPLPAFDGSQWRDCDAWLYGVDLFNRRYWWEAHESWERCWIAAGRETATGQFLQGLIQVAVACLKHEQGMADVARRMATEGFGRMAPRRGVFLGVDSVSLEQAVHAHLRGGSPPVIRLEMH